jgi:CBS domain-containing protein
MADSPPSVLGRRGNWPRRLDCARINVKRAPAPKEAGFAIAKPLDGRRMNMNVEAILRAKGRQVTTIAPDATIAAAVHQMTSRGIGALVVTGNGAEVAGIVSERDIVRGLSEHGDGLLGATVADLMTRRVISCSPDDSVADLMSQMTERRIRHLPVMRDGALCGIISIGDVVKNRLDEVEFEASSLRNFIVSA